MAVNTYSWAFNFATVDVIDDIMGRATINGAAHRLSCAKNLFNGTWETQQDHLNKNNSFIHVSACSSLFGTGLTTELISPSL